MIENWNELLIQNKFNNRINDAMPMRSVRFVDYFSEFNFNSCKISKTNF